MLKFNFDTFPLLVTERLTLRRITKEDAFRTFKLRSNLDAMRYIARPIANTINDALALHKKWDDGLKTNSSIMWGICLENDPELIGNIGFHKIDKENYRAEIGYMLFPEFWNQGIMSETMAIVLDYGFKQMGLHSIEAHIDPENKQSSSLLAKFNFQKEGYFKENFFFNGEFLDTEIYSLIKS